MKLVDDVDSRYRINVLINDLFYASTIRPDKFTVLESRSLDLLRKIKERLDEEF